MVCSTKVASGFVLPRAEQLRICWALLLALVLESLLFCLLVPVVMTLHSSEGRDAEPLHIQLATPVRSHLEARALLQPPVVAATPVHLKPRPLTTQVYHRAVGLPAVPVVPAVVGPLGAVSIARPSSPGTLEVATRVSEDGLSRYTERLRQAIQAAVRYPASERALGQQGKVRVSFVLQDGELTQLVLVSGSGRPALDRAALHAVLVTQVPPAPATLKVNGERCQITIVFELDRVP
jgi:TonB family protein